MYTKYQIAHLEDRVHRMELLNELDRQGGKTERESRVEMKRRIGAEHRTIRVTHGDRWAEPIGDPARWHRFVAAAEREDMYPAIKWYNIVHAGVLYRFRAEWRVRVDIARAMGYDVIEV